ncbi:MAG: 5-amino-6-(5-phosphoribosylamino)uracil reductase [Actinomycetia bacterium]|nr:5-amino-6-(5-phosphoribosylamino)uracil reductase [Actinomycetes bacterium]
MTALDVRIEAVFESDGAPDVPVPDAVRSAYGGPFRLPARVVYANFVSSIDGVASIGGVEMSSAEISGGAAADRFVMALLRAVADAVVVGAGTLREHDGPWAAEKAYPPGADSFSRLRAGISASESPKLVVVTASGELPGDHPALADAIVVTTSAGARSLTEGPARVGEVIDVGDADRVDGAIAIHRLREHGYERILTEGGPGLMGAMLEASAVEQLFLTISPKLIGGGPERSPLTDETDLLEREVGARLLSIRRSEDFLFLRYGLSSPD